MKKNIPILFCVLILFFFGVLCGSFVLPPTQWIGNPIFELRALRMLAACIIGGSLALSGMAFQAALRNPLAEPFILGISSGASVGAALAFILGLKSLWLYSVPCMAFAGAFIVFSLVLWISRKNADNSETLLLSGVIVSTITSGILMFLLSFAQNDELAGLTWWMLGDLQGVEPDFLIPAGLLALCCLLLFQYLAGNINVLSLGRERAHYLGVNPKQLLLLLIIPAAMLAASTVVLAGMIGFCGLVIPHIVRRIYGCNHKKIIGTIFLWGAGFLMLSDIISRSIWPEREIPIGVLTALIGGPVFLWILNKKAKV